MIFFSTSVCTISEGVITVEVHFDLLDHAHLYVRRQERATTWDVSKFYKQSPIGATWKWTATRDIFVVLLRVVVGTWVITSRTIDCWHNQQVSSLSAKGSIASGGAKPNDRPIVSSWRRGEALPATEI